MNNITTNIIDTVSFDSGVSQVEEFEVTFNPSSKTIDYEKYSVKNVENYPSILRFINNSLSNFDLLNENEIINFIIENIGLIELIEKVIPIINNYFSNNKFALEFDKDPEIPSFNKIILYVNGGNESFDEDWEDIKKVNKEIRLLSLYDDSVKCLLSVDLW